MVKKLFFRQLFSLLNLREELNLITVLVVNVSPNPASLVKMYALKMGLLQDLFINWEKVGGSMKARISGILACFCYHSFKHGEHDTKHYDLCFLSIKLSLFVWKFTILP